MSIGYTRKQADRIQAALQKDMAKIEDAALSMIHRVPDHSEQVGNQLEDLRAVYHTLWEMVERRTR